MLLWLALRTVQHLSASPTAASSRLVRSLSPLETARLKASASFKSRARDSGRLPPGRSSRRPA